MLGPCPSPPADPREDRKDEMSDKQLTKIEKLLAQVCEQQSALCEKIETLEGRMAQLSNEPTCEETVAFLDGYRAQESFASTWINAWIDVSDTACVRGGLRTVQQREAMHAQLLEERIKELGGTCSAEVPRADRDRFMKDFGGTACSDVEKLQTLVKEFGSADDVLKPLRDFTDRLDGDPETQYLMRTILQDEVSSLQFLTDACELLS